MEKSDVLIVSVRLLGRYEYQNIDLYIYYLNDSYLPFQYTNKHMQ